MINLTEDKLFGGNKLNIDLTPVDTWGVAKTFRQHCGDEKWFQIESHVKNRVDGQCEFCGASETKQGIFGQKAHKFKIEFRYAIDEATKIATLHRLLYSCISCSQSIHLRQTQIQGKEQYNRAVNRLCSIHNIQQYEVERELHRQQKNGQRLQDLGIPEKHDVFIIEDGINRLW